MHRLWRLAAKLTIAILLIISATVMSLFSILVWLLIVMLVYLIAAPHVHKLQYPLCVLPGSSVTLSLLITVVAYKARRISTLGGLFAAFASGVFLGCWFGVSLLGLNHIFRICNYHYFMAHLHLLAAGAPDGPYAWLDQWIVQGLDAGPAFMIASLAFVFYVLMFVALWPFLLIITARNTATDTGEIVYGRWRGYRLSWFLAVILLPVSVGMGYGWYHQMYRHAIRCIAALSVAEQHTRLQSQMRADFLKHNPDVQVNLVEPNPAIAVYVARLKEIRHLAHCSPEVQQAFQEYIDIWSAVADREKERTVLRAARHAYTDPFGFLEDALVHDPVLLRRAKESDENLRKVIEEDSTRNSERWARIGVRQSDDDSE
jgi:hypothetical protein